MQAGKLRHRLRLQAPDVGTLPDGSMAVTFADIPDGAGKPLIVYGRIAPMRMTEQIIAQQDTARALVTITIRWLPAFLPTYQFVDVVSGRIFEPTGIINIDERNREIRVVATEKVPPSA